MGLNGVDNGRIWFHNARVPRDNMLDAFASVDERGNYSSSIPSVSKRFGTMVGGLTTGAPQHGCSLPALWALVSRCTHAGLELLWSAILWHTCCIAVAYILYHTAAALHQACYSPPTAHHAGRILIGQGAIDACKIGLTIAIRYSAMRPQFGDKLIIEYLTHQRRLMPGLASTYAHHLAMANLKDLFCAKRPEDAKIIHVLSSGLKAASTWSRVEVGGSAGVCV
jgi:alkylation response protein AidB-like acyl-CoA dehydrogenase